MIASAIATVVDGPDAADAAARRTCKRLSNLVAVARMADAKIVQKTSCNPHYMGSIEEMDDLHEWFIANHEDYVADFCLWCHERRKLSNATPSGTDICRSSRSSIIQYDTSFLSERDV